MEQQPLDDESDGQLIRRFAEGRDERAFALLVERRGALVSGVCARMQRNPADAEDAYQAVFLVLARRAHALRRTASLAGWLHAVAVRVCLNERKMERRRQRRVQEAAQAAQESSPPKRLAELKLVIDEELAALPQRLREVLVLCDLEGCSRDEVARTLSLPLGTVSSRLARGRSLMRKRLVRHGLPIAGSGVAIALGMFGQAVPALSALLVQTTARNAHVFVFGTAAAKLALDIKVSSLAEGVLYAMIVNKWKIAVSLAVLMVATLIGGTVAPTIIPGLVSMASGATILFDDFDDGSLVDGRPVSWRADLGATLQIQDESLIVSGSSVPLATPLIGPLQNVSILARARLLEGEAVGVAGRRTAGGPVTNYFAYVGRFDTPTGPVNEAGISLGGVIQTLTVADIPFDPRNQDFNLQLDIFGNEIRYWVWLPGQPRPAAPLGTAVDNTLTTGEVFAWAASQGLAGNATGRGAFRFIHVATTTIPEPTGVSLAAAGGGLLAAALLFGRLRFRHVGTNWS